MSITHLFSSTSFQGSEIDILQNINPFIFNNIIQEFCNFFSIFFYADSRCREGNLFNFSDLKFLWQPGEIR